MYKARMTMNRLLMCSCVIACVMAIVVLCACSASSVITDGGSTESVIEDTTVDSYIETETTEATEVSTLPAETDAPETAPSKIEKPVLYPAFDYIEPKEVDEGQQLLGEIRTAQLMLLELLETPLYTDSARAAMEEEFNRLDECATKLMADIDRLLLWEEKLAEYPYAAKTWLYLKELGYSDVACAGIIGNMMAECGGHTLNLQPFIYDSSLQYYGLCQWSGKYYPEVHGASFEDQLKFLENTIQYEFKTFGKLYDYGFNFDKFNNLTSPRDAALAFAMVYERCASWTYARRQSFAEVAYEYFVIDFYKNACY